MKDKNMTIEVGVYLDRLFIKKVQESLGISSNQELTELIAAKWSGVSIFLQGGDKNLFIRLCRFLIRLCSGLV